MPAGLEPTTGHNCLGCSKASTPDITPALVVRGSGGGFVGASRFWFKKAVVQIGSGASGVLFQEGSGAIRFRCK